MKTSDLLLLLLSVIFATAACKKDEDKNEIGFNPGTTNNSYAGTASTNIQYWDYDVSSGTDVFLYEKSYSYPVYIFTKPSLSVDGVDETNPFNLQIYPERENTTDEEGHIDLCSCLIIDDTWVGEVILQYWNISLTGEKVTGTLADTHHTEAAAANMIWCLDDLAGIEMVLPFYMAAGTTMNGQIDQTNCTLDLSGESTDSYRKFTINIQAAAR